MSKTMTVDILSSIKGAQPSESVNQLFDVIKNAIPTNNNAANNVNQIGRASCRERVYDDV